MNSLSFLTPEDTVKDNINKTDTPKIESLTDDKPDKAQLNKVDLDYIEIMEPPMKVVREYLKKRVNKLNGELKT